jgi:hypothetical protein
MGFTNDWEMRDCISSFARAVIFGAQGQGQGVKRAGGIVNVIMIPIHVAMK